MPLQNKKILPLLLLCLASLSWTGKAQESSPLTLNGGSVLAMAGKNCVAVAVDKRFGSGPALVQIAPPKLLVASPRLMVACTGLQTDVQSLQQDVSAQIARTFSRGLGFRSEKQTIPPRALAMLTSHILYNRKNAPYYVEPLVIGLEAEKTERITDEETSVILRPYLCSFDMIGARSQSDSFVCAGAASKSLHGTAEALWKKDASPEELVQLCGEAFLSALERDCLSGYGALVYLVSADGGIKEFNLDTRTD